MAKPAAATTKTDVPLKENKPMKHTISLLLLLLTVSAFGQVSIFGTNAAISDTASVVNTTAKESRMIKINDPLKREGKAMLYVAGDKLSGTQSKQLKIEVRMITGPSQQTGDTLFGHWQLVDSVETTYLDDGDISGAGKQVAGKSLDLPQLVTNWNIGRWVQFRFSFAAGTHKTRLLGLLEFY
jgi:hypothetical protein